MSSSHNLESQGRGRERWVGNNYPGNAPVMLAITMLKVYFKKLAIINLYLY